MRSVIHIKSVFVFVFVMKRFDDDELLSTRACVRASFLRVLVEEKKKLWVQGLVVCSRKR